ncbi:carbohydrate ABC transporter permease [Ruminiclostridium cellobioparum]|jgi:putative aldouronate transport system permease protein|uniref:ABC-type sugar transport system, permease component n=1 Tax=Ruminiclostridium cellobioparum subsp. termitidis CT1112 TaxID=1195236 RepID=S0FHM9_RUMCE|nr:carbohydrate ABC transporter permease [Ruminiclostridium cellobioparum]EMS69426.1 ABC-type sugar transport system, permease component [Ruminiclostridium cellobioparum subsp. termitidis CT1112]
MRIKRGKEQLVFNLISYTTVIIFTLLCVIPFLLVISGSFTDEGSIHVDGYRFIPKKFSLNAYRVAFAMPTNIIRAYGVTGTVTVVGTLVGLFIICMTAYALQRPQFKYRNAFALYFYFTTLFSGGLVPWYILMVRYLHLKNNYLALLFPAMLTVFDIIIMRSFMKSIPEALAESAKIDGAGEFRIFAQIFLPLSKPALATVGLFIALRYWNDWYASMLFITQKEKYSLQFYLYSMLTQMEFAANDAKSAGIVMEQYPAESFKLAMTIVATGPILLLYPFVQKYFIQGMTVGAVKG